MVGLRLDFKPVDYAVRNGMGIGAFWLKDGSRVCAMTNKLGITQLWRINSANELIGVETAPKGPKLVKLLEKYHDKVDRRNEIYYAVASSSLNRLG